jgi:hypothetical protein
MADWFYAQGTTQQGPVALNSLIDLLRSGALTGNDLVWRDGMAQWTPAGQVPELAGAFASAAHMQPVQQSGIAAPAGAAATPATVPYYGQPYYPPTSSPHASMATTSMVLGIVSFLCMGFLLGPAALITGIIALNGMKRTGDVRKKGFAITGVVLGSICIALYVALILFYVLIGAGVYAHHAVPQQMPIPPSP